MKSISPVVSFALSVCVALPTGAQVPPGDGSKIELIMPGEVIVEETTLKKGDTWWVLFQAAGEEVRLRYAPLELNLKRPGSSFHMISAMGFPDAEVIMLFRGSKELPRGPVATVFNGQLSLLPGTEVVFDGFGIKARVAKGVGSSEASSDGTLHEPYEIRLSQGESGQLLFAEPAGIASFNDTMPALLWAGDLDKDHKLDLLLDISTHYAAPSYALYLSTYAQGDELVHLVAEYHGAGC